MTGKPPVIGDEEIVKAVGYKYGHCVSPFDRKIAQAQLDDTVKWHKDRGYMSRDEVIQWLEEKGASGKVECPDCVWNRVQGGGSIGMTPCYRCDSTGFINEPLRLEEK